MKKNKIFRGTILSKNELSLIIGGSDGVPSQGSSSTTIPSSPLTSSSFGLGSECTIHQGVTNPLGSAAMLVGTDMSFGTSGIGSTAHEASHTVQGKGGAS